MSNASSRTGVIPASLSFLTIYNPSFSCSDETLGDQILYYSSEASKSRASGPSYEDADPANSREVINERLRQVGLAQGMVEFAKCLLLCLIMS